MAKIISLNKGISFGAGFDVCNLYGSQNNDAFYIDKNGEIKTRTNNHGGILGGISSGMPISMKIAMKPTPSISQTQDTVDFLEHQNTTISVRGRHDPCVVPRAVPVAEAALNIALLGQLLKAGIK